MYRDLNDIVAATQDAVGIVFANNFETLCLWKEYHEQQSDKYKWKGFGWGQLKYVGFVGNQTKNRRVCVSVGAFFLNGQVIVTIEDTSRFVDHTLIEEWALANWPKLNNQARDHTNAMNFHIVAHKTLPL